jgi:hypothetical protein
MKSFFRRWFWLPILIAVIVLLWVFGGWRPILTLFGFRVEPDNPTIQYEIKTSEVFEEWKNIIKEYEGAPTYINAEKTYRNLTALHTKWETIMPPNDYVPYHRWILQAIEYDTTAFGIISGQVSSGNMTVQEAAIQLWGQKDNALKNASEVAPK